MKRLMSDETVLYVTEYSYVKAVRSLATVEENLVSIDKGTTSQPLIKQLVSIHAHCGTVKRGLGHKPNLKLKAEANTDIAYQTHSTI
jgi:hypothetical protein